VYDPEGALGWISAAWMTFLGLQAGRVFVKYRHLHTTAGNAVAWRAHLQRWILWGIVIGGTGGGLCGFSQNEGLIPINKNLWSPTFVFCMAGIGFLVLSLLYAVVDIARHWSGAPLRYIGMNSILIYACHEIFQAYFPFTVAWSYDFASHAEAITSNLAGMLCWVAISRLLYLRGIFVNV
jgi:heparan-alpha-glucosaminide N-acetyltransferase